MLPGQIDTGRVTHLPQMHRQVAWKAPVRVATTAAGTLATGFENGDTIDGVVLATGDRILIKDQTDPAQNGIYVVKASGAPARAYDMDRVDEVTGAVVLVLEGTAVGKLYWTGSEPAVLGDDDVVWEELTGGASGGATGQLGAGYDGGLSVLVAPKAQDVVVPFDGEITGWHVYAQQSGDANFGIGKADHAGFDTFTSIVGATAPSLSSAIKNQGTDMTGWTTGVVAGDILRFTLSTVSAVRQLVLVLDYDRT